MTKLYLAEQNLADIMRHGEAAYPHEGCGLLLGRESDDGTRQVHRVVVANNSHDEDHGTRYLISPDEMLRHQIQARKDELDILGFFHSHPDAPAQPSRYDLENAWPWYTYLITSVSKGRAVETTAWRLAEDRDRFIAEQVVCVASDVPAGSAQA